VLPYGSLASKPGPLPRLAFCILEALKEECGGATEREVMELSQLRQGQHLRSDPPGSVRADETVLLDDRAAQGRAQGELCALGLRRSGWPRPAFSAALAARRRSCGGDLAVRDHSAWPGGFSCGTGMAGASPRKWAASTSRSHATKQAMVMSMYRLQEGAERCAPRLRGCSRARNASLACRSNAYTTCSRGAGRPLVPHQSLRLSASLGSAAGGCAGWGTQLAPWSG
jgi:hypothetical protein